MVGLSRDRFPDLLVDPMKLLVEELTCGICHQIYDNPVETHCRHTYCLHCLKELVSKHGQKLCPECRKSLTTRKRTQSAINDNNVVIINGNVIVDKNGKVNAMVGKLRTKCDFEAKGCPNVCPLESLPAHLKICPFKKCETCGQPLEATNQLLEWKDKYKNLDKEKKLLAEKMRQLETKVKESEEKTLKLESELKRKDTSHKSMVQKYEELEKSLKTPDFGIDFVIRLTSVPNLVMLGKCTANVGSVEFSEYGIALNNVLPNGCQTESIDRLYMPYERIQRLYSCVSVMPSLSMLCIKPRSNQTFLKDYTNDRYYSITDLFNDCRFDVNSYDPSEQYIIIEMMDTMKEIFLLQLQKKCHNNNGFNYITIDLKTAQRMRRRAKNLNN